MNSFIPIGSLKRDEIYSFIGGFFVAALWQIYFINLSSDTSISSINLIANPIFFVYWLSFTALLFTIQSFIIFIAICTIKYWLKNKSQIERKKILNLQDPVEDFIAIEFVNEIKLAAHLVGIILTSVPLSLFPLYKLLSSFAVQKIPCLIVVLIVLAYIWLLFLFIKLLKMFTVIHLLKVDGSLEIIDLNTFAQKRAEYIAEVLNKQSKQKLQNYLEQQKHSE